MAGNYLKHQKSRKTLALILMLALLVSSWGFSAYRQNRFMLARKVCDRPHEGNGHGTDGTITGIDTILEETQVPMADLPSEPKAMMLSSIGLNGLENAVLDEQTGTHRFPLEE